MFPFERENARKLTAYNIRISELQPSSTSKFPQKAIHSTERGMQGRSSRSVAAGIRVTNIKSIRPPDPIKKQEDDKLRAQLQKEIVSRSRSCAFKGYECTLPVLSGRQYCYRHILRDNTAPYRQCTHTYGNGERCPLPAPSDSVDARDPGLCYEHARAALSVRQRQAAPPAPVVSTETLLQQLSHHVRLERARSSSCASTVSVVSEPAEQEVAAPSALDPFRQIDAASINMSFKTSVMECCSESESDADSITLGSEGNCRLGLEELSEAEDGPTEELPLWHAGVFTAEEAVGETKNTLKMLQTSYFNQMKRLKVLLQTARLQYLRSLKAEKEQYCSINTQARSGPLSVRERRQLRKLKAYASYHKKHGVEAVLAKKLQRKRAKPGELQWSSRVAAGVARCTFSEGGVRCEAQSLPAARHCLKHILHDKHQVLFSQCESRRGLSSCREPVARLPQCALSCRYHAVPPVYTLFTLKKEETETESEYRSSSDESQVDVVDKVEPPTTSDLEPSP